MSWNISRIINNLAFDVSNLKQDVSELETKTVDIVETNVNGTVFDKNIYADKYIINNGPNPAQFLLSDGTSTILNDSEFIIVNTPPFNNVIDVNKSKGDVYYDTNSSSVYGFQPPFMDEPVERSIPSPSVTNYNVSTEAGFVDALNNEIPPETSIQITLTANITFTSSKTITPSRGVKIISDNGSRVITFSSSTNILRFEGDDVILEGIHFLNSNAGSSATCIAFTSTAASNNYVKNCTFYTNEFAITSLNPQIQITDCYFLFTGTSDSHRYIALYKNTGNTIIARNVFQGNTAFNTACIFISGVSGSSFTNGSFVFKNNTTYALFPVQRLCIADAAFGVNDNVKFWIHDNTIQSSSGFMIFYNPIPMTGVYSVVAYNNTETLGGTAIGSKGIIACDNATATTLPSRTGKPYITTFNNIQPALRADYTGWTTDNNVAYNTTVISTVGNTPKLYSAVLQDVIGGNTSEKTANIVLPLPNDGTRFLQNVYADKFIIEGGPSPAGYLLSDGTILNSSSSNNNSNIYLYNNNLTTTAPPANGQIRFNNSVNQNATQVYISHMTRDGIDVDPFISLISQLSILYIQDQDDSANYIKYNVNSAPTITPNSYVSVNVTFLEGGGTGLNAFPAGMNIFLSLFTNDTEIDTRLSNLETKTQNMSASSSSNIINKSTVFILDNFGNFIVRDDTLNPLLAVNEAQVDTHVELNVNNNRIINVGAPSSNTDATTKSYVDASINNTVANYMGKTNIINNATPYINSSGLITSNVSNLYCQAGVDNLQTIYNNIQKDNNYSIELSSGTHPIVGGLVLTENNVSIVGQINSTSINADIQGVTIGSAVSFTSQLKFSYIKFISTITFYSGSGQALNHYFQNCDFLNVVTFSTIILGTGLSIFFNNCKFSYGSTITFPNTQANIYFYDCEFSNNIFVNNLGANQLNIISCRGLNSTSVTNVKYVGVNQLYSGTTNLIGDTLKLTGTNEAFLKGDGSLDLNNYITSDSASVTYLAKTGGTMTGGLNMGAQNITNCNTITATSLVKSGGTSTQLLLANGGTLATTSLTTVSPSFFNLTIAGVTPIVSMRKIHNGTTGTVTLYIANFSGTAPSTSTVLTSTNAISDTTFRPGVTLYFPVRIRKSAVTQMGTLIIYSTGLIGITDVAETANFWTSGNTGCGIVGDTCISYTL